MFGGQGSFGFPFLMAKQGQSHCHLSFCLHDNNFAVEDVRKELREKGNNKRRRSFFVTFGTKIFSFSVNSAKIFIIFEE